jgi:hypothetical protein
MPKAVSLLHPSKNEKRSFGSSEYFVLYYSVIADYRQESVSRCRLDFPRQRAHSRQSVAYALLLSTV